MGTRTSSKKTSLNSASPVICTSGRTVDAGRLHVDEQVGDARVLRRVGIGAARADAPVRAMREAGPHLLAVDDPVVAVAHRPRLRAPRGRTRRPARRTALAPDLFGAEDRRDVAALLLLGAPLHEGRADHHDGDRIDRGRCTGRAHLLRVDDLLHDRGARVRRRPRGQWMPTQPPACIARCQASVRRSARRGRAPRSARLAQSGGQGSDPASRGARHETAPRRRCTGSPPP